LKIQQGFPAEHAAQASTFNEANAGGLGAPKATAYELACVIDNVNEPTHSRTQNKPDRLRTLLERFPGIVERREVNRRETG
jgi:hypothetical protein